MTTAADGFLASPAAELGRRLLGEAGDTRTTLNEILQSLRVGRTGAQRPYFGVPAIDDAVLQVRDTGSSGRGKKSNPPILELASTAPAVGKTSLVYLMIARAITSRPSSPGAVVVLDADGRFDVARLVQVMTDERNSSSLSDAADIEEALRHVHIFRPASLESLVATVANLESYLLDTSRHHSAARCLALVVVDGLSAFYWPERWRRDCADMGLDQGAASGDAAPVRTSHVSTQSLYVDLVAALTAVQETFDCGVVATTTYFSSSRALLPVLWQKSVQLRLHVGRVEVRKFHTHLSLEDAERERTKRQAIVDQSIFVARVDIVDNDIWSSSVPLTLTHSRPHNRILDFVSDESGVLVED